MGRGWGGGDWVVLFCFIIIIFLKLGLLGLWWVFTRFCFSKFGFWVPVGSGGHCHLILSVHVSVFS